MSRIYEAFKRSESETSAEPAAVEESDQVEPAILEHYVAERRLAGRQTKQEAGSVESAIPQAPLRVKDIPESFEGKLVVSSETAGFCVEQYRKMAAVLEGLQKDRKVRTLMVSSALPNEGKTLTVSNLALTFSESYKRRVLLIDADLRQPSIQKVFGLAGGPGLCDDIRAPREQRSAVQVSTNLSILQAGQVGADPMAELSSNRMRALIEDAASRFDWVLLDTPPLCLLPDAHLVARVTDGVLLVVAAGTTPYQVVSDAISKLGADRILGTVLNRADTRALSAKDYYLDYYRPAGGTR